MTNRGALGMAGCYHGGMARDPMPAYHLSAADHEKHTQKQLDEHVVSMDERMEQRPRFLLGLKTVFVCAAFHGFGKLVGGIRSSRSGGGRAELSRRARAQQGRGRRRRGAAERTGSPGSRSERHHH